MNPRVGIVAEISYPSGTHERSACSTGKMSLKNRGDSITVTTSGTGAAAAPFAATEAGAAAVTGSEHRRRRAAVYGRRHHGRRRAPPAVGEMARPLPAAFLCERVEGSRTHRRTGS